jgi:hypothetical protein
VLERAGLTPSGDDWQAPADFHPADTVAALVAAGVRITAVHRVHQTLEDFYLETIRT